MNKGKLHRNCLWQNQLGKIAKLELRASVQEQSTIFANFCNFFYLKELGFDDCLFSKFPKAKIFKGVEHLTEPVPRKLAKLELKGRLEEAFI
ncbi:MAG: hypothetical protein NZ602_05985 [Thermoguttaceae bacterium]|nr:hypothetical protein [Thermoguttaceae bacterium]